MGEYIKNEKTGDEKKIGVLDKCFYSRQELLAFKEQGYNGFYNDKYDTTIDTMLKNNTLFSIPELPDGKRTLKLSFDLKYAELLDHKEICIRGGEHFQANFFVPCLYNVPVKYPACNPYKFNFVLVGERWKNGTPRAIFECGYCGAMFSFENLENKWGVLQEIYTQNHILENNGSRLDYLFKNII